MHSNLYYILAEDKLRHAMPRTDYLKLLEAIYQRIKIKIKKTNYSFEI